MNYEYAIRHFLNHYELSNCKWRWRFAFIPHFCAITNKLIWFGIHVKAKRVIYDDIHGPEEDVIWIHRDVADQMTTPTHI